MLRTRNVVGQLLGARNYEIGHLVLGTAAGGSSYPVDRRHGVPRLRVLGQHDPDRRRLRAGPAGARARAPARGRRDVRRDVLRGGAQRRHGGRAGLRVVGHGRSAGTCGVDDLQADADPWFANVSQDEIGLYVVGDGAVPEDAVAAEVQSVAFTGFDGSDAFKLSFAARADGHVHARRELQRRRDQGRGAGRRAVRGGLEGAAVLADRHVRRPRVRDDLRQLPATSWSRPSSRSRARSPRRSTTSTPAACSCPAGRPARPATTTPVVTAPADRTIPVRTPFALSGSATDPDSDPLVHQWQQVDAGGVDGPRAGRPGQDRRAAVPHAGAHRDGRPGCSPTWRRWSPATPTRRPGPCAGATACFEEWLPTAAYASPLHFRLVARDRKRRGRRGRRRRRHAHRRHDDRAVPGHQPGGRGARWSAAPAQAVTWTRQHRGDWRRT